MLIFSTFLLATAFAITTAVIVSLCLFAFKPNQLLKAYLPWLQQKFLKNELEIVRSPDFTFKSSSEALARLASIDASYKRNEVTYWQYVADLDAYCSEYKPVYKILGGCGICFHLWATSFMLFPFLLVVNIYFTDYWSNWFVFLPTTLSHLIFSTLVNLQLYRDIND